MAGTAANRASCIASDGQGGFLECFIENTQRHLLLVERKVACYIVRLFNFGTHFWAHEEEDDWKQPAWIYP